MTVYTALTESEKKVGEKFNELCHEIERDCRSHRDVHYAEALRYNITELADSARGFADRLEELAGEMDTVSESDDSSAGLPIDGDDTFNLWDYRRASLEEINAGAICSECICCHWRLEYMGGPGHRNCMLRGEQTRGRRTCNAFEVAPVKKPFQAKKVAHKAWCVK